VEIFITVNYSRASLSLSLQIVRCCFVSYRFYALIYLGSAREYGPAYMLQEDVILVTINYRLVIKEVKIVESNKGFSPYYSLNRK
jgi:hypothetical protein